MSKHYAGKQQQPVPMAADGFRPTLTSRQLTMLTSLVLQRINLLESKGRCADRTEIELAQCWREILKRLEGR